MGAEFDNKIMRKYLKRLKINYFTSVSENKCSMVEIVQKTIQRRIYSYMVENETLEYIDTIPHIVFAYNNSIHRSISLTPEQAKTSEHFKQVLNKNLNKFHRLKQVKIRPRFKAGDIVRVSIDKSKARFTRSYNLQNSYAKYQIYKVVTKNTVHAKYFLKHIESDKLIRNGYFYEWQLTRCTNTSFRGHIVKTRKRKGKTQYLFHYKGYSNEFDEWKDSEDVDNFKNVEPFSSRK